ncbi:hypothetical protein C900_05628 [Fulvivirga imtechensis AK7]|uniref:Carboxypeptidase regulatory-like domain-containing protein n=1 Tax=Fulvivirga imtechensis AK7 TaxID=1237149 RepID=L8JJF7_9BACT|nr:carboxypeptidase-like regulatory domain-containing protein [Fulvivirga imtechensis]ELR68935.1 hypothetical protein C900_05628 [Fulvivirga imtechensis AK7]
MKHLFIPILVFFVISCKSMQAQKIEQGITGTVRWYEGNMMPGPDTKTNEGQAVEREIHIYELVTMQAAHREGELYKDVPSKLVTTIMTDRSGNFSVSLPPGRYSLFTKEEDGLFANTFDGEGNINPVTVKEGKVTEVKININYKAYY